MTDSAEIDASPFVDVPGAIDIARYFWHEIVMTDQEVPYRRGQYHGCDGIGLWREGADYCYLWVEATVDHDMWMAYLLEIRTNRGGVESRDHLYLAAGAGDLFEVEWRNKPIRFDADLDDHVDHHRAAMFWFVEREVGTIDDQNGGDQGIIDRAAARVNPPRTGDTMTAEIDALLRIAERVRDEANTASRAGQYDRLNQIALDLEVEARNRRRTPPPGVEPLCQRHDHINSRHDAACYERTRPNPPAEGGNSDA